MRKFQRNFAVEYKSSRRDLGKKPSSIWGDVDLKALAEDLPEEPAPVGTDERASREHDSSDRSTGEVQSVSSLTQTLAQNTTAEATGEKIMADEDQMPATADEQGAETVPDVAQTRRKPRKVRTVGDVAAEQAPVKKRRGRKPKAEATETPKRRAGRKQSNVIEKPSDVPASAADEMADLLQLEQENQRLRKLLAEKLRAENAELRKRLNLN